MKKIDTNGFNKTLEHSYRIKREHEIAEFKEAIKERGILPILREEKLFIYKISKTEILSELITAYKDNMSETYNVVVLNDEKFKSDLCKSSYLPFFRNMLNYRPSTPEEIWEKFNLNNEQSRKDFIEQNAREIEIQITMSDLTYLKGYRKEKIGEIVKRISHDYVTCIFKRDSKLSAIIDFIGTKNYFDLDFIASKAVEFLSSNRVAFASGSTILKDERMAIDRMPFTDKEKSMSEDEKLIILKDIKDAFNIECVYCEEVDKISDSQLESMLGTSSRENVIDFSKHNTDILDNSDFSPIYNEIMSNVSKTLKKQK